MSVSLRTFFTVASLGALTLTGLTVPALAFDSDSGDSISTSEPKSNYHVSANTIAINEDISRDLVAAGNSVVINADIERNALLAGNQVTLNGDVGGSIRAAGNQLTLNGTFGDDVIVAGNQITISDTTIEGDLVVGSNQLNLVNSTVTGDLIAAYDRYDGDALEDQIEGEVRLSEGDVDIDLDEAEERSQAAVTSGFIFGVLWREIGVILALLALTLFLKKRGRLHIPSLEMNQQVLWNFLLGLGLVVIGPVLGGLLILFAGPTGLSLILAVLGVGLLSGLFLPIYIANLLKNSAGVGMGIFGLTWLVYFGLLVLNLLGNVPVLGWLLGVLVFVLVLANLGYVLMTLWRALSGYVAPRKLK